MGQQASINNPAEKKVLNTLDGQDPSISQKYSLTFVQDPEIKEFHFSSSIIGVKGEEDDSDRMSIEHFQIHKVIGRGTFGKVLLVQHKEDGRFFALKILNKNQIYKNKQVVHTIAERQIQARIEHPFIVCLRYAFQTTEKLYMLFDYINGGELFHHLDICTLFDEERARFYAAQIYLALQFLHSKKILYRDLKPENILLTPSGDIKLTDFGLAKELKDFEKVINEGEIGELGEENNLEGIKKSPEEGKKQKTNTFCGTKEYIAPEIILGKEYGMSVDYWSLGVLIYEMLTGDTPFVSETNNQMEIYQKILYMEVNLDNPILSDSAKDLMRRMLHKEVNKRISPADIKTHPFFKDIDWDKILNREVLAPYRVNISGPDSTTYISKEFTEQIIKDTPATAITNVAQMFVNFSYIPDSIPDSVKINTLR